MVKRPFSNVRPFGPVIDFPNNKLFRSSDLPEDQEEIDRLRDEGPSEDWIVGPELAHHVWQLTDNSEYINHGPEPPIMLESLMYFFNERSTSDSLNNWYFARIPDKQYDIDIWEKVPSMLQLSNPSEETTEILYDISTRPNPLRSLLHSQQYTNHGAMITYEFKQMQDEEVTGFSRIPVPSSMSDKSKDVLDGNGFEYYEYQFRSHTSNFGNPPEGVIEYFHPHFRANDPTLDQMKDFFTKAVDLIEEGIKQEKQSN